MGSKIPVGFTREEASAATTPGAGKPGPADPRRSKEGSRGRVFQQLAMVEEQHPVSHFAGKALSWVTQTMLMPSWAQLRGWWGLNI